MSFPLVMKFGGVGLEDGPAVLRACDVIAARRDQNPIVVVSAHAGVTAALEASAQRAAAGVFDLEALRIRHKSLLRQLGLDPELLNRLLSELSQVIYSISDRRSMQAGELDFVLSLGERMSARVVAASLRQRGHDATPIDAFDLGLTTDSCHGQARPLPGTEASLRRSLDEIPGIPVITGFLAKDGSGNLTTMGRNGSDLTAALVSKAVGAKDLILWKTVAGLMTADPALVPNPGLMPELSIDEAAEMAFHGASVLHPTALDPLRETHTSLWLRDMRDENSPGTRIHGAGADAATLAVTGCTRLMGLQVTTEVGSVPTNLFALMHAHHVQPRFLDTSARGVTIYAPPSSGFEILIRELADRATRLPDLASVVLVGGGARGVGARALELLNEAGLDPRRAHLDPEGLSQVLLFEMDQQAAASQLLHRELCVPTSARRPRSSK